MLMNFNTDGFNERNIYIHNNNDINNLKKKNISHSRDNLVLMKARENLPNIKTSSNTFIPNCNNVRGRKDNFVLMNKNINNMINSNLFKK